MAKILYCSRCKEKTAHNRVGSSDQATDGVPLARALCAIGTFGASELLRDRHYECRRCSKIATIKG